MATPVLDSLLRINRQRMLALRKMLTPRGYVGFMHLILLYTRRNPGASQEEIAGYYALDKASVAHDARRLEDAGHIRRQTDPANRRQNQLFITPAGEEMAAVIDEVHLSFQRRLSAGISPEDWEKLTALLAVAEENARQTAAGPAQEKIAGREKN